MCPSAPRVCSEPGGQKPVLSLSLDLIGKKIQCHNTSRRRTHQSNRNIAMLIFKWKRTSYRSYLSWKKDRLSTSFLSQHQENFQKVTFFTWHNVPVCVPILIVRTTSSYANMKINFRCFFQMSQLVHLANNTSTNTVKIQILVAMAT